MFDLNYGPSTPTFKARSAAPDWADMSGRDHFVQIYTDDGHIMEAVSGYFLNGLRFNEACVMIGTGDHNREVERLVRAGGADVDAAISEGTFVILDACETLAAFMADGMPRKDLFDAAVGPIVRKAAETRTHVRAFGETSSWSGSGTAWRKTTLSACFALIRSRHSRASTPRHTSIISAPPTPTSSAVR